MATRFVSMRHYTHSVRYIHYACNETSFCVFVNIIVHGSVSASETDI
jgi:hypothetical protein